MGRFFRSLLIIATFAFIMPAFAGDFPTEDGVLILGDSNLAAAVKEYDYLFVSFYAPWSNQSNKFIKEFPNWSKTLSQEKFKITFAKVDATKEKQVAKEQDIYRYPINKLFIKGDPIDYDGPALEANITAWLKTKIESSTTRVSSPQDVGRLTDEKGVVLLFFGGKKHKDYPIFNAVSKRFDDVGFLFTKNTALRNDYRVSTDIQVLLLKKFDEGKVPFTGELTLENLSALIVEHRYPIVQAFEDTLGKKIFSQAIPTLFLVSQQNEEGQSVEAVVREVAPKIRGKIMVTICDYNAPRTGKRLSNYIDVTEDDLPAIRIVYQKKGSMPLKYIYNQEVVTAEKLLEFVESFKNGTLKPYLPSESIPETNNEPVKVVVSQTFKDIVFDSTKDVFIEFYSPKCYHCKKLAPIWDELATTLASIPNLVIAKIDGQANVFEDIHIPGFPMLRFYPANNKDSPIDFDGDRKLPTFLEWLKDKLTVEHDPSVLAFKEKISVEL